MKALTRTLFLMLALLPFAACHEIGHVDSPTTTTTSAGELVGEVEYIDTGARQIEVRTEAGRAWNVNYDSQTRVIYRQRNYAISNLEPGDYVALRTRQDRDGRLYTDTITVRDSVQDRGYTGARNLLQGTVLRHDPRYNSMVLESFDKRQFSFFYDTNTRVRYRNRSYAIANIEPGDRLNVRPRDPNQQTPTADAVTVVSKLNDPTTAGGTAGRLERFEGNVEFIDVRRGQFEVRGSNRLVVVNLLYNPAKTVADRFNRLRNGDFVRIEGRFINQDRFELENFLQ